MPDTRRSYLFVPAGGAGEGMGHLARCLALCEQLGSRADIYTGLLDAAARKLLADRLSISRVRPRPVPRGRLPRRKQWDLVVVDARRTSAAALHTLTRHGLVACIDEGGEARDLAPFTIDALPGLPGRTASNMADSSLLILPPRFRRAAPKSIRKILVSLGGEDREALAERLVASLLNERVCSPDQLTVVEGPLTGRHTWPAGVTVLRDVNDLARLLRSHDLLITHFGMTAFEALAVGTPSVLFNPSRYHEQLGAAAGFAMIGTGTPSVSHLKELLRDPGALMGHVERFNASLGSDRRKLERVLRGLRRIGRAECPVCGKEVNRVIARFEDRTYRQCAECGIISLESFAGSRKEYGESYFSTEYKAQYGRTYLEDFAAIREASRPRAAIIKGLLGKGFAGTVLDVGCAYGPFLAAVDDAGLDSFGLDVSAGAVAHVKGILGLPAVRAGFEEVERKRLPRRIAAVTLWYVLEHFTDTERVLAKAAALLPAGGVFAFSTPNGRGISARRDLHRFLSNSPGDHFVILSPRSLGKILEKHGLALRRVRVTGHHPERFPGFPGTAAGRWPLAARVVRAISIVLRLGDTFEAYAVKGRNP